MSSQLLQIPAIPINTVETVFQVSLGRVLHEHRNYLEARCKWVESYLRCFIYDAVIKYDAVIEFSSWFWIVMCRLGLKSRALRDGLRGLLARPQFLKAPGRGSGPGLLILNIQRICRSLHPNFSKCMYLICCHHNLGTSKSILTTLEVSTSLVFGLITRVKSSEVGPYQ